MFFAFLVKNTSGILFFGPSFRKPARKALSKKKKVSNICRAVVDGCQAIKCGDAKVVVCGGMENMSRAPHALQLRAGVKMGNATMVDTMNHDGLTDAFLDCHMGVTGECREILFLVCLRRPCVHSKIQRLSPPAMIVSNLDTIEFIIN